MSGECEKNRFGPPAPAIARPRKTGQTHGREQRRAAASSWLDHSRKGTVATPATQPSNSPQPIRFAVAPVRIRACKSPRTRRIRCLAVRDGRRSRERISACGLTSKSRAPRASSRSQEIAAKIGAPESALHPYGRSIAKLESDFLRTLADRPDGKLILVSAISPTPAGEGKTTTTVGLGDALNRIGRKTIICLREPSLGPCFGMKGGATGGGYAQVVPMDADQPSFHRRLSRHNLGAQSPRGDDRQSHVLGQCARPRSAPRRLAARPRHERPRAARDGRWARRRQMDFRARTDSTSPSPRK